MKVLVTGGDGQLARAIAETWTDHEVIRLGRTALDLADLDAIPAVVRSHHPDLILNAGAHTAVDRCESEPDLARRLNAEAVAVLARCADELGIPLFQISTDYVFDGTGQRPYGEGDPTGPRSVYGRTKLDGEVAARKARAHLIIRTAWLYDAWGKNFYRTMLNVAAQGRSLKVVDDQQGTPTSCRALARQLEVAAREGWRGTVHVTCSGATTWCGFAREIFRQHGLNPDLQPCTTADYPTPAPRPAYSVLGGAGRSQRGTDIMPDWKDALSEVVTATRALEREEQP
jgi:dTDP-4-dehydrorhamnose reductase